MEREVMAVNNCVCLCLCEYWEKEMMSALITHREV